MIEQFLIELERIAKSLARDLFNITIPQFKLEISRKTPFTDEVVHIAVGVGIIDLSSDEIFAGILHELVHIYNRINGVSDQTANRYHNQKFKNSAIRFGLHCEWDRNKGWYNTTLIDTLQSHIERQIDVSSWASCLSEGKRQLRRMVRDRTRHPCFLKYVCKCPPPHNSIRSGRRPNGNHPPCIRCEVCGAVFVCDPP